MTPEHPLLVEFLDYWRRARGDGGGLPARADIDPLDIPRLLRYVYMLDVHREPLDFSYRLLGTDIVAHTRRDYSGCRLSEIAGEDTQGRLLEIYRQVCETGAPAVDRILYETVGGNDKYYENVVTPLSEDGVSVSLLFGAAVHLPEIAADVAPRPIRKLPDSLKSD